MLLNYAYYFGTPTEPLHSIMDFLIEAQMSDGDFNCESNQHGAIHSSLHSTISVLEGLGEYRVNGYMYRAAELDVVARQAQEFILRHRLYRSDHTGEIIQSRFLMLSYPYGNPRPAQPLEYTAGAAGVAAFSAGQSGRGLGAMKVECKRPALFEQDTDEHGFSQILGGFNLLLTSCLHALKIAGLRLPKNASR